MGTLASSAAGLIAGAILGSFIATLVVRWPKGRSVLHGRSSCDSCGRRLGVADLVPLLSYVMARGRCRSCGQPINPRHPTIELAAAAIGGISLAVAPGLAGIAGALLGWQLLALAALDLEHHWLPDPLNLLLLATGLAAGLTGMEPPIAERLIGAAFGFAMLWMIAALYKRVRKREGLGGGDPKMLRAIGAWLGWQAIPTVLLIAAGMGLAVVLIARIGGRHYALADRIAFGALMAPAAWLTWIFAEAGWLAP